MVDATPKKEKKAAVIRISGTESIQIDLSASERERPSTTSYAAAQTGNSGKSRPSTTTMATLATGRTTVKSTWNTAKKKPATPAYITCSRYTVNHTGFITLTTILTMYALLGDDVRLLATEKPSDDIFNAITIVCMVIFSIEVIMSCIGKEDYLGSFFFFLDIIATTTMALDLTWINDLIYGDDENLENLQGSRTAKLGARTARVVRVLRLVRIIKLYKAIYDAKQARKKQLERLAMMREGRGPGQDDDDDWEDAHDTDMKVDTLARGESRVGKRLSDRTTRKVIILVLSMMLALPILKVDDHSQLPFSPVYGAGAVYESYSRWSNFKVTNGSAADIARKEYLHDQFSRKMLQMIYYHNWYTGNSESCPIEDSLCSRMYFNYIFWVGIITQTRDNVALQEKALEFDIKDSVADEFAKDVDKQDKIYNYGPLPAQVQSILKQPWSQKCDSEKVLRLGFSMIGQERDASGTFPPVSFAAPCPEDLRRNARGKFTALTMTESQAESWHIGFYVDRRNFVRNESLFSLLVTAFVCVVLCGASLMFSNDADKLVLNPVEIMISKVERIRDNPLMAMKMSDEDFRQEQVRKQREKAEAQEYSKWHVLRDYLLCNQKQSDQEPMETVILEKTIIKIGSLLALGFGEAGASIIEHNMSGVDSAMVTAMVEGSRVECIIGCTRIRNFSIATEVLQGTVINFVNKIAEVVHGIVDELHGAANKNNGEYFLLIWRTSDLDDELASKLADMSMLALTRILGAIHRTPALLAYRTHPGLQMRLKGNTRVDLSFSLHYGWAIEGAVGSEFKIDASYLSPNVSIAESLESATHIYGVSILVSELVINICSPQMAAKCRRIDRVKLTGIAMELYCIDLDYLSLSEEPTLQPVPPWNPRQRFRCRQFLEQEKALKWCDDISIVTFFNTNPDVATMRFRFTLEFTHVFNMGFQNYSEGEWIVAKRFLSLTKTMLGTEDGPSAALLHFMEHPYGFQKPDMWKGVRDLGNVLGV